MRRTALGLLVAAISCGDATGPGHAITDLEAARQRWQAQNLHRYALTIQRSCFCANVHRLYVLVLADTVTAVLDLETGEGVDRHLGVTVDGLFTFIDDAITHHARLIRADYDASKGFPTEIDFDGAAQIADDEVFYRISDVHPVFSLTPQ